MSLTVKITQHVEITDQLGDTVSAGSKTVPVEVTAAGDEIYQVNPTLADATELVLWTAADAGMADFDFLWLESDQDLFVEFRNDNATPAYWLVELLANVPFILSADESQADDDTSFLVGAGLSTDTIDQIEVRNESGSTANIKLILVS